LDALFELADFEMVRGRAEELKEFGADCTLRLQDYYAFTTRLLRKVLIAPEHEDAQLMQLMQDGVLAPAEGSVSPKVARRASLTALKLEGKPAAQIASASPEQERLHHVWPPPEAHLPEIMRKLTLLNAAVAQQEGFVTKAAASKEFRMYCKLAIGRRRGRERRYQWLTYAQMDSALMNMAGQEYGDLMFRYAVVGREGNSNKALSEAEALDTDLMVAFLRWLDQDCDGVVSQKEFCRLLTAKLQEITLADLRRLGEKRRSIEEDSGKGQTAKSRWKDAARKSFGSSFSSVASTDDGSQPDVADAGAAAGQHSGPPTAA